MSDPESSTVGGVILCGGRSTRMGEPKLSLPFGVETMLERTIRLMQQVVSPIVVVAAVGQALPELAPAIRIVRDEEQGWGPLGGIAIGLEALASQAEAAYVAPCDAPLLKPEFVQAMIDHLTQHDIAVPREEKFCHPLAAVYRTHLATAARELINQSRYRPLFLLEQSQTHFVDIERLRDVDPELDSLRNMNTPEDYQLALERAGFSD